MSSSSVRLSDSCAYACSSSSCASTPTPHQSKIDTQRQKIGAHKEAEEVLCKRAKPPLKRQSSYHQLQPGGEIEDLSQQSGEMWDCIKRFPNKLGGYIYKFKLKKEYDDITPTDREEKRNCYQAAILKNAAIYPAVERTGRSVLDWDRKIEEKRKQWMTHLVYEQLFRSCNSNITERMILRFMSMAIIRVSPEVPDLHVLGYESSWGKNGVYLRLPDREALLANWETLREIHPGLRPIDIVSSEGIADDLTFVETYQTHDALLSNKEERIHDTFVHVIPNIKLILASGIQDNPTFDHYKFNLVREINKEYRCLMITKRGLEDGTLNISEQMKSLLKMHIPKIEATLGAITDNDAARSSYPVPRPQHLSYNYFSFDRFNHFWNSPDWNLYWSRRFGDKSAYYQSLQTIRLLMKDIEVQFDVTRIKKKIETTQASLEHR